MGLLDGVVGGVVGAEMASVIKGLIEKHGGVQGIVSQLESQGLGAVAKSWVSNGPNQAISADQVHQAFGPDTIRVLAAKVGLSPQDLAGKLSTLLPQVVDKLTPNGQLPEH
jgi:uncharacterized protein YidB (DUF937 family)